MDRCTLESFEIPLSTLMENAGAAVARFCLRHYPATRNVVIICGKGNNGGDGFVVARILAAAGIAVEVILLGREEDLKGDAAAALEHLHTEAPPVTVTSVFDEDTLAVAAELINSADLLVDALIGTGFRLLLRGLAAALCQIIARIDTPVVAVDLPSGWNADSIEQSSEIAFRADAVVTFTAPKLAHVFGHLTTSTFGPVVVAEIGSPADAIQSATALTWTGSSKSITEQPRSVNANKGKFGHVLVVGGSYGTAGAPSMTSLAALRTGAGLVTAAIPKSMVPLVAAVAPELMLAPLHEGSEGEASLQNLEPDGLEALIEAKRISVIALGPGLSTRGEAGAFARSLVEKTTLPMVLDADALNAFAGESKLLDGTGRTLVLTPHPGEMARLTGLSVNEVEADRVVLARSFATQHNLTLVLKGWRTLIAHPDGRIAVNTSGNPAMAKGGSGDILTGIIAALLAQFPHDVAQAVEAAVYLHGLAADCCVTGNGDAIRAIDEHTLLATNTLAHLSDAFRYRAKDADGLIWVCGIHEPDAQYRSVSKTSSFIDE